jgi:hypothetical protein
MTAVGLSLASNAIPFDDVQAMVNNFVTQQYGVYHLEDVLTYYGQDELPNAYAFIYRNSAGDVKTVTAGARWTCTPISEISPHLPNYFTTLEKAQHVAQQAAKANAEFDRIYFFGPQEEYFSFNCGSSDMLVNTYSMRAVEKEQLMQIQPVRDPEAEQLLRAKWHYYLSGTDLSLQYTGYVPGVPYCLWSYGCSPTTSAMLFWYWDIHGYGDFVDHFFDRWDNVEQQNDFNLPNVQRQCAIAMNTDSTYQGSTSASSIRPGHLTVANTYHNYSFTSQNSPWGSHANQWLFSWIKNEIDNGRPTHWAVLYYYYSGQFINHSVCAVGYDIILPDTFVVVHNTWNTGEYSWALWTYHNGTYCQPLVVTLVPGGGPNPDNIFVDWPYIQNTWMFRGLKYEVRWDFEGTGIDHVKMWLAPAVINQGYDSVYWSVMENSYPNTGSYIYDVPDETLHHRINLVGLNASNQRLAADGSFAAFDTRSVIASNVELFGHNLLVGNAKDIVVVGNYAYLALGDYGIGVVDISDTTLLTIANIIDIGGSPSALFYDSPYLYCATYSDSGFVVLNLSNPASPAVEGSTTLVNETFGLYVSNNIAYVTARTSGLRVVDVSTPSSPSEIGHYDTNGQSYDVCLVSSTTAVVADGTRDLKFFDITNPAAPESIATMSTPGIPKGLWYEGYLFVGDGPAGVGVVDVSNPAQPESLVWINTDGQPYHCERHGNVLFICDGPEGLRLYNIANISSPVEIGYLNSYGNANDIAMISPNVYVMADGDDGIYAMGSTVGIEENNAPGQTHPFFALAPNPFSHNMKIEFSCDRSEQVMVAVYNVLGAQIQVLANQEYGPGLHELIWNGIDARGRTVAQGVYFVEINRSGSTQSKKVVFMH